YTNFDTYLNSVSGKNSSAYYRRRCQKSGYSVREIDPDQFNTEIHTINVSMPERQGRKMDPTYIAVKSSYREEGEWLYLGVCNSSGALVGYLFIHKIGEVAYVGPVLGHGDFLKDGVMYLLFTEAVSSLIQSSNCRYFMYDMFFGGSEGLRLFKTRIGF